MPSLSRNILPQPGIERARVCGNLLDADYRFAKTMPENPHWYTLRKTWADDAAFVEAVEFIRRYGYIEIYKGRKYTMYNLNGYKYWTMGASINKPNGEPYTILINRAKIAEPSDYDQIAESYDSLFADEASEAENQEIIAMLPRLLGARILDIGCGTGLLLKYRQAAGYVGIDPSAQMLGQLVTRYPEYRDRIIHGRFEEFFDTGRGFDQILALFGVANYIDPAAWCSVTGLLSSAGFVFAMFYQPAYTPVTYQRAGVEFSHYPTAAYDLSGFELRPFKDTYLIATYSA